MIGGGHANVQVLRRFGMRPEPGVRITLISADRQTPYSGMLPGCISGVYRARDIHIQLDRLCRFAGARFVQAQVTGIHVDRQQIELAERPPLYFDALALNSGAVPLQVHPQAICVKPISRFLPKWAELKGTTQAGDVVAVVGAGAGGVELAMAMRAALPAGVQIVLVGRELLASHNRRVQRLAMAKLDELQIHWLQEEVSAGAGGQITLSTGRVVAPDKVLWVTHVTAPDWLAGTGLAADEQGFVKVNPYLQSVSHPAVFAAGDVAHLVGQERAKSGVYAVRAGPYLADNLRRFLTQRQLKTYRAQPQHLALLGTGDGSAIASRGEWGAQGKLYWRLKDWIDWRFMNKFNRLPTMPKQNYQLDASLRKDLPDDPMRCGGCGAKLAADPLRRVLARLPTQQAAHVKLGIGDDAAELSNSTATTLLTVDGFRAMIDDPYLFGRIAAHHSLNDIFAMGAKPSAALAFVTVPLMSERMMEEELFQLLSGATAVLNEHQVPLVGGHSAEGAELSIGLTVTGTPLDTSLGKGGGQPGDRLILTKALGTGVILAAAMQGLAPRESIEAVLQSMDTSNFPALQVFMANGVNALTDVTGFGLAGHLGEMLRAGQIGAAIDLQQIPVHNGALELLARVPSSLQAANELALQDFTLLGQLRLDNMTLRLLADPQTSGGLLAMVPAEQADTCLSQLRQAGVRGVDIGQVTHEGWTIE